MPESVGMNGQIDWQAIDVQLSRAEVLRGLRNFRNMNRSKHHRIDRQKERGVEKGSDDILPSEVKNDLCSNRETFALFRGLWGDC